MADKVTNYLLIIPLYRGTSHEIDHIFCKQGPSTYFMFDEHNAVLSIVM